MSNLTDIPKITRLQSNRAGFLLSSQLLFYHCFQCHRNLNYFQENLGCVDLHVGLEEK